MSSEGYRVDVDGIRNTVMPQMQKKADEVDEIYANMLNIIGQINTSENIDLEAGKACVLEFEKNMLPQIEGIRDVINAYKKQLDGICGTVVEADISAANKIFGA